MNKIKLILIASFILLITVNAKTQTHMRTYDDATTGIAGFSYDISISYKLLKGWSKARPSEVYSVKLVHVVPSSRGFFYSRSKKQFYSCAELGSNCNPNNWRQVIVDLTGHCKSASKDRISFSRLNEEHTIEHWVEENGNCSFNGLEANVIQESLTLIKIIDDKERAKTTSSSGSSSSNPSGSSSSPESLETKKTETNTVPGQIPDSYTGNPLHYNNPNTSSGSNALDDFNKGYQQGQDIANIVTGLVDLFSPTPAQLQRRAAAAEATAEQARREAAAAELRAQKTRLIAARKDFVAKLPNGKTPLSYQAKEATEVYFFTYSYQAATLENDAPIIYISNVFAVAKYGDGTWPFKSNLITNIAKTNKGLDLILSDYYLSKNQAEEQQRLLVRAANSYDFSVQPISYAGIKSSGNTEAKADYWGNATNKGDVKSNSETKNKPASANSADGLDFWGNPTTKDEKKPEASTEKKQETKDSKKDTDFWGNPTNASQVMLFGFVYMQKCNSEEVEYHTELLVVESGFREESKKLEAALATEYPNAKRIKVGCSKIDYGSSATNMCLIKWLGGSKACSYYVFSISFGKTQQDALNNAMKKKNTYADKNAAYEIVEQKYW
jgi:hypothetical protein